MKDNDKDKGSADLDHITPAKITLTKDSQAPSADSTKTVKTSIRGSWLVPLIFLVIIAGAVFFILPSHVETPRLDASNASLTAQQDASRGPGSPAPQKTESSPFQEAQEARQRGKSQELLSEILRLQEDLEDKNVLAWGETRYNGALQKATQGDEAYRNREFNQSISLYGDTLEELKSLLSDMDIIFTEAVSQGFAAIQAGDSTEALDQFDFALLMYPDDEDANKGLSRAQTLDQVLQLMTEGNDLLLNDGFESAREKYQQALALDPGMQQARQQINIINTRINDRDFNRLMSAGYRNLQQDRLEDARLSFQKAKRLKPNAPEVLAALDQTQTNITNEQINQHMTQAVQYETQENWTEALAEYNRALALDPNLAQAQEGEAYSQSRINLDNRLKQIIAEPQRLSNRAVYEETRLIVQQANSIPSPEPRLSRQLVTINKLLNDAMNPVNVMFVSDNQTQVRINRIGDLGSFEQTSISLLPGSYVVVGTRQGYRDVRLEFTVPANQQLTQPITVIASERIASR